MAYTERKQGSVDNGVEIGMLEKNTVEERKGNGSIVGVFTRRRMLGNAVVSDRILGVLTTKLGEKDLDLEEEDARPDAGQNGGLP